MKRKLCEFMYPCVHKGKARSLSIVKETAQLKDEGQHGKLYEGDREILKRLNLELYASFVLPILVLPKTLLRNGLCLIVN